MRLSLGSALLGMIVGGVSVGLAAGLRPFQVQEIEVRFAVDGHDERRLAGSADHDARWRSVVAGATAPAP
ncbi:hypothetical protein [Herbidospora mongoliensis]|uniref:hypothetical protein n=1 Tax=Herbidospora mongoliensis TaxID=688067 RepID=UPI000832B61A|nr:hypothetical protein [Herbidospora mongoliensis]